LASSIGALYLSSLFPKSRLLSSSDIFFKEAMAIKKVASQLRRITLDLSPEDPTKSAPFLKGGFIK